MIFNSFDGVDDDINKTYQHIDETVENIFQNINDSDKVDPNIDRSSKINVIGKIKIW